MRQPLAIISRKKQNRRKGWFCFLVAAKDLLMFAKQHLPFLFGTAVSFPRTHTPRPVYCIH